MVVPAVHRTLALLGDLRVVARVERAGESLFGLGAATGVLSEGVVALTISTVLSATITASRRGRRPLQGSVRRVPDGHGAAAPAACSSNQDLGPALDRGGAAATAAGRSDRRDLAHLAVVVRSGVGAAALGAAEVCRVLGRRRRRAGEPAAAAVEPGFARGGGRRDRCVGVVDALDDRCGTVAALAADGEGQGLARRDLDRRCGGAAETAGSGAGRLDTGVVVEPGGGAVATLRAERLDGDLDDVVRNGPLDGRSGEGERLVDRGRSGGGGSDDGRRRERERADGDQGKSLHVVPLRPRAPAAGRALRC